MNKCINIADQVSIEWICQVLVTSSTGMSNLKFISLEIVKLPFSKAIAICLDSVFVIGNEISCKNTKIYRYRITLNSFEKQLFAICWDTITCSVTHAGSCVNYDDKLIVHFYMHDSEFSLKGCYEMCLENSSCAGFLLKEEEHLCALMKEGCIYEDNLNSQYAYYAMSDCDRGKKSSIFWYSCLVYSDDSTTFSSIFLQSKISILLQY